MSYKKFCDELLAYIADLKAKFKIYMEKEKKFENLLNNILRMADQALGPNYNPATDEWKKLKLATDVASGLLKNLRFYYKKWEENEELKHKLTIEKVYHKLKQTVQGPKESKVSTGRVYNYNDKTSLSWLSIISKEAHSLVNSMDFAQINHAWAANIKKTVQTYVSSLHKLNSYLFLI